MSHQNIIPAVLQGQLHVPHGQSSAPLHHVARVDEITTESIRGGDGPPLLGAGQHWTTHHLHRGHLVLGGAQVQGLLGESFKIILIIGCKYILQDWCMMNKSAVLSGPSFRLGKICWL